MQITIITGASRGIGKAIAEDLKSLKSEFVFLSSKDIDLEQYNHVRSQINYYLTVRKYDQINLILCAAQIGTAHEIDLVEFEKLYRINVLGNLAVIEAARRYNVKLRIVWFAGGGAAFPYPEFFGYSLSKVAVVRAVENLSKMLGSEDSIIALAPGAVETDMLKNVLDAGCEVRTRTDISEPVNFVRKFITDEIDSKSLNGCFLHVRDNVEDYDDFDKLNDLYKLRRIE
jgi:NAD(P)-dependent dehydrogenase (short-subunit alcohol dehydrogenase family)